MNTAYHDWDLEDIENYLGPSEKYISDEDDKDALIRYAQLIGKTEAEINIANMVQLINWYCEKQPVETINPLEDRQKIYAEIFIKVLEAVNVEGFNVELTRVVAKDEFNIRFKNWADIISTELESIVEKRIPRKIEIVYQNGSIVLDGIFHYKTEQIIKIASLNHPVMQVGPAGCGKTTIGQHVAKALNLPFYITSTINEAHQLTGFIDGYGKYHTTPFRQAFEFGGVWVADEIDAWDASALLTANAALANGYSQFPDRPDPIAKNSNFRMVATANTFGNGADRIYIGRNELDAASLDRFAIVNVDYDLTLEKHFANGNDRWLNHCWEVRRKVNDKKIRHVVSSRAIAMGSAALSIGLNWKEVEEIYLFKGMNETDRKKVLG